MESTPRVFVSATSADLGSVRKMVRDGLLDLGCHPVEQTHFPPDYRSVVEMLEDKIRNCQAVVHIVGMRYGAEPNQPPSDPEGSDSGVARRSFTQLEYDIARRLKKKIYVFVCPEDFPYDEAGEEEDEEKQELQRLHRQEILASDLSHSRVSNSEDVGREIRKLRIQLDRLRDELNREKKKRISTTAVNVFVVIALLALVGWLILKPESETHPVGERLGGFVPEESHLKQSRKNACVVSLDNKIYVMGGINSEGNRTATMEIFDLETRKFRKGPDAPQNFSGAAAFALSDGIYVAGGETKWPFWDFLPSIFDGSETHHHRKAFRYDPKSEKWNDIADLPYPVWDGMGVAFGDRGFVMGGRQESGQEKGIGGGRTQAGVLEYDRIGDKWTEKAAMLEDVRHAGVLVWEKKIWVFGGLSNTSEETQKWETEIQIYDPAIAPMGKWEIHETELPERLTYPNALESSGGRVWIFARGTDERTHIQHVWAYDGNNWTKHYLERGSKNAEVKKNLGFLSPPVIDSNDFVYFFGSPVGSKQPYRIQLP